ncbi:V-type ATPase, C subunit family protein [Trichomonas vaginalis G3]|uniref:V-type proton ATPase proteolipid subunit n=1 Tax=Trichomonas vaginalis (strain ATCC PRA-98 / G3) TaxID=412133 RepID=A2DJA7_TRIV3|nr:ATP hydrolysis coupled proton transport [Trichomonas vaginalis G3]EAY19494.1 V-type ATPase, C subunit family protein [Trichomonas vaginalis G3]KAI5520024.1 ATP hydrolysis coupled proton transport [Trichomonas vaginalis G3]|eukprot:XP_001580480.1 V-type ATPase, C subunit family protein [Trichomonas vaginalis G3]
MSSFEYLCPAVAPFFSYLGIGIALAFTGIGSGYGTAKSAIGVFAACAIHPEFIYKGLLPVVMAGIVGIYGLVAAVIINPKVASEKFHLFDSYAHLAAGISVGLCGLASGMCIGVAGDAASRVMAEKPQLLMGAMLVLIFGEVLGLYGFIVACILSNKSDGRACYLDISQLNTTK